MMNVIDSLYMNSINIMGSCTDAYAACSSIVRGQHERGHATRKKRSKLKFTFEMNGAGDQCFFNESKACANKAITKTHRESSILGSKMCF